MPENLGSLGTAFIDIVARQDKLDNQFSSLKNNVKGFATALGVTLGASGIVLGFKAIIGAASQFESSFAGVRKTVAASPAEFKVLSDSLRGLAKEIPLTVNQINAIAETAGQLGVAKEDIVGFTKVIANLASTTNLSAEQAATSIAEFANVMGTAGSEFSNIGSAISGLGNASSATETKIVDMAQRLASAGRQIDLTEAQVLGFATSLASVGIEAQAGGTALSRLFSQMNVAVATGNKELKQFAEIALPKSTNAAKDFAALFKKDAAEAVLLFVEGLRQIKVDGGSAIVALENLGIQEVRLRDSLLSLASAGDKTREFLRLSTQLYKENNATTKEAAERYKTFDSQVQILKNSINDLVIDIGGKMLPVLTDMAKGLASLVQAAQRGEGPLVNLSFAVGALLATMAISKVISFGQAIYSLILVAGTTTTAVSALDAAMGVATVTTFSWTTALGALRLALLAAAPPLAIAAGIAVIAYEVWNLGKAIHDLEEAEIELANAQSRMSNSMLTAIEALRKRGAITAETAANMKKNFMEWSQEVERGGRNSAEAEKKLEGLRQEVGRYGQQVGATLRVEQDAANQKKKIINDTEQARRAAEAQRKQDAAAAAEAQKAAIEDFKKMLAPADELNKTIKILGNSFSDYEIVKTYGDAIYEAAASQREHGLQVKGAIVPLAKMAELLHVLKLEATDVSKIPAFDFTPSLLLPPDLKMPEFKAPLGPVFSDTTQKAIDKMVKAQEEADDLAIAVKELKARGKDAAQIQRILGTEIEAVSKNAKEYGITLDEDVRVLVRLSDATKKNVEETEKWEAVWAEAMGNIVTDFNRAMADLVFSKKSAGEIFKGLGQEAGQAFFKTFTTQLTEPIFKEFQKWGKQLAKVIDGALGGLAAKAGKWLSGILPGVGGAGVGTAAGGTVGVGAGAGTGAAGGLTVGGALAGAATVAAFAAPVAGVVVGVMGSQLHRVADDFVQNIQNPFDARMIELAEEFKTSGGSSDVRRQIIEEATAYEALLVAMQKKTGNVITDIFNSGKALVAKQATQEFNAAYGTGAGVLLAGLERGLTPQQQATIDAEEAGETVSTDPTEIASKVIAGIPATGLATSASNIFAKAVDKFVAAIEVGGVSAVPQSVTFDMPLSIMNTFTVSHLDDPVYVRDVVMPEITTLLETGGRTFLEKWAKLINGVLQGLVSTGPATA